MPTITEVAPNTREGKQRSQRDLVTKSSKQPAAFGHPLPGSPVAGPSMMLTSFGSPREGIEKSPALGAEWEEVDGGSAGSSHTMGGSEALN